MSRESLDYQLISDYEALRADLEFIYVEEVFKSL